MIMTNTINRVSGPFLLFFGRYLQRMPKPLYIIMSIVVLLVQERVSAQSHKSDSLIALLPSAKDTTRVNLLNQISSSFWYSNPAQTIEYADQAIGLAKELNLKRALASAYNNKGVGYYQQNKYEDAIKWYNEAIGMHKEVGNFQGEAFVLSNIGMIYWKQTKLDTAVQYYLQSMKIWEDHKNEEEIAGVLQNIGNVYSDQDDYTRALEYYFKALEIERRYKVSDHEVSMTLSNIGTAYLSQAKFHDALKYFLESLNYLTAEDVESRAVSLSNIGVTYAEMKEFQKALPYLTEALQLQEEIGDDDAIVHTLNGLAHIHFQKNELKEAEKYAKRALDVAVRVDEKNRQAEAWLMLANIAEKQGDFKSAYNYYTNHIGVRDSIRTKENIYQIAHLEANYQSEKKLELLKKENEQKEFRRNAVGIGLIALLIIAGLIVSRQRLKIKQHKELIFINAQLKKQSQQLEAQTQKLRELDTAKSTFFANISHEFRTPLTLILNSLIDRISTVKASGDTSELDQLEVMHRNARRLLNLINQLLDLSRLDARQMKLSPENCNLTRLINIIYASFSSLSYSRQINFSLLMPAEEILCRVDSDKFEKILYNLLSNAFKFTPVGGSVELKTEVVRAENNFVRVAVSDSGRGIASDQIAHVFDRFYQGNQYYTDEQGTGIGLALTKELVELHKGKIWVESEAEKGAKFIIQLPLVPINENEGIAEEAVFPVQIESLSTASMPEEFVTPEDDKPTVLLVEDNEDLRRYIQQHLSGKYQVIISENGRKGLEKAISTIPDLVISDWMMPEMDGITLCSNLKTDERTSHIPIIILTALAGDEVKLKGLETGADDYLTKPFDNRELHVRVKNLIDTRRQLREKFSKELHLGPKKIAVTSMDEKFLERVMETVETHMGDPDFSMEKFGQQVGLSRMQLHRKLKALTNQSPGDFLRTMRLQRAKRLLESRSGNVSEIAYEVGFNNLSYFSKCYKEEFGISPNESAALKTNSA